MVGVSELAKKVTMQQIADYLGVSKFVVSKALSGKGGVSESTKERVIQAASQLGYFSQKNAYVKQLKPDAPPLPAGAAKQSVLVLMPNIRFQTRESVYWGRIVDGVSARLEEEGLGMLIVSEQSVDQLVHLLNPSGILGLIGVGEIGTSLLLEVHRIGLPMVLVDHEDPLIPTDSVFVNNYDCMRRLTDHLMGIGHRDIVFVGNERYSRSFHDRWMGFRTALEERDIRCTGGNELKLAIESIEGGAIQAEIAAWAAARKRKNALPTAIVCSNDAIAIATVQALGELGVRVPDDVSVSGFDNIEDAYRIQPALTTVNVPKEALGRRAVEKLLERLRQAQAPLEKLLIAGDVIYRDSIAEARDRRPR